MKRRRKKTKINFPPRYSPIPLETVKVIFRIFLIDQMERRRTGHVRATRGLYNRLAQSFGIPRHTIERICMLKDTESRRLFRGVRVKDERRRLRRRRGKTDADQRSAPDQP